MDQYITRNHRAAPLIAGFRVTAAQHHGGKRAIVAMPVKPLTSVVALMADGRFCK